MGGEWSKTVPVGVLFVGLDPGRANTRLSFQLRFRACQLTGESLTPGTPFAGTCLSVGELWVGACHAVLTPSVLALD